MPDAPVPITPTFLPVKSTGSCGQLLVCSDSPVNRSAPGNSGLFAADRQPTAVIRYLAWACVPSSVRTVHRFASAS